MFGCGKRPNIINWLSPHSSLLERGVVWEGAVCIRDEPERAFGLEGRWALGSFSSLESPHLQSCSLREPILTVPNPTLVCLAESQQVWGVTFMSLRNEIRSLSQRKEVDVILFSTALISSKNFAFFLGKGEQLIRKT